MKAIIRLIAMILLTTFFVAGAPVFAQAQSVSECQNVPPVHHRMFGISGPSRQGDGVENTIAGMQATYNDGGRWFETDIQQLENEQGEWGMGKFILFHDATLNRTTDKTGSIRELSYSQLPLTSANQPIPTLGQALAWLRDHPGTHLLIEIKMRLQWKKVIDLLKRYNFDHKNRVMFDIGGAEAPEGRKHDIAVAMHKKLGPYVVTGVKRWDSDNRPATWIRNFGTQARLDLQQGIDHKKELIKAGVKWRFSKILNGNKKQTPASMWRRAVESGAFTHILTERTAQYLEWCRRVSSRQETLSRSSNHEHRSASRLHDTRSSHQLGRRGERTPRHHTGPGRHRQPEEARGSVRPHGGVRLPESRTKASHVVPVPTPRMRSADRRRVRQGVSARRRRSQ